MVGCSQTKERRNRHGILSDHKTIYHILEQFLRFAQFLGLEGSIRFTTLQAGNDAVADVHLIIQILALQLEELPVEFGNQSATCFYRDLVKKEFNNVNPLEVFENVYQIIKDRKEHPKEGSYTNYLFDKGIDKILKKVGEECTELVIAAKNPDPEEIKYEMSDFLYHAMVLMVERGVTWEDITEELANR